MNRKFPQATLTAVGDLSLGDHYFTMGHGIATHIKKQGLGITFKRVNNLFLDSHLVLGNLETPLSNFSDSSYSFEKSAFRGDPSQAAALRKIGFNLLNVANNHILQHGEEAFSETIRALRSNKISCLGLRASTEFYSLPIIKNFHGSKIGFLGFSFVRETYAPTLYFYAKPSLELACNDVKRLAQKVDLVVVSAHWGDEGTRLPSPQIVQMARKLVQAGARVILGHHPHVFHPIETYESGLIFYSLGNFLFDLFWHSSLINTAIVKIWLEQDSNRLRYKLYPTKFSRNYMVEPLNASRSARFIQRLDIGTKEIINSSPEHYKKKYFCELEQTDRKIQIKKVVYFLRNLFHGHLRLKLNFLARKINAGIK